VVVLVFLVVIRKGSAFAFAVAVAVALAINLTPKFVILNEAVRALREWPSQRACLERS
jgi:hypothetical protein